MLPLVPLAVTVTAVVPAFAVELPVKVSVDVPLPGAGRLALLNAAVTPAGSPVIVKVTGALNPPTGVTVRVTAPLLVWVMESVVALTASC